MADEVEKKKTITNEFLFSVQRFCINEITSAEHM